MTASSTVALRARQLGKRYEVYDRPYHRLLKQFFPGIRQLAREFWALQGVDMDIYRGETVGIIGRNGSGKSTLLQILCGTLRPSQGTVELQGRVAALLELGAGFNPEFTGVENVLLNASILGLSREEIDSRMEAILDFAGIGDFAYQPVKVYSSGMYLRLAFSVVAHVDADVLVIDEALAVGDVLFTQKCMRFLRRFQEEGTVILVSHDMGAITSLCQRVFWLEGGRLRMAGDAKTVSESFLEYMYAEQQSREAEQAATHAAPHGANESRKRDRSRGAHAQEFPVDMRRELLLNSNLRNDLQVFAFDPDKEGFGAGKAKVENVSLRTIEPGGGRPITWAVGGEQVVLCVRFLAQATLENPIVGFQVKDRFGQVLFGDNTFLARNPETAVIPEGSEATARFRFRLPYLRAGEYVVSVAVATGTQQDHVPQQWIHDALVFRCETSHAVFGLVGVPMSEIELSFVNADEALDDDDAPSGA